ncbi:MAG: LamG-like jellyroll fold domain-containing protein [Actinomycetota bacterium]
MPDYVYDLRARSTNTTLGTPTVATPPGTATTTLTHVVMTHTTNGTRTLYLDGTPTTTDTIAGTLTNWDPDYPLTIANTTDGTRPWNGTLCLIAIYDRALTPTEITTNHTTGCSDAGPPDPTNEPPVAVDDTYSIGEDLQLDVDAAGGVLANDTDPDLDPLTAVLVTDVSAGTLSLAADGSFTYLPDQDANGIDSFTYRAADASTTSAPATVTIDVLAAPDAPESVADAYSTPVDQTLVVDAGAGVLADDSDADGDPLTAVLVTDVATGDLDLATDGSFTYAPPPGFVGDVTFSYEASDGSLTSPETDVVISVTDPSSTNAAPRFVTGTVAFTSTVLDSTFDETHAVEPGDFDADGDIDLVATDLVDGAVEWLRNDGGGTFTRILIDGALAGAYPVSTGDVDGDGAIDVLATGYDADTVVWYRNDGSGNFTRRTVDTAADGAHSVVPRDLDQDGDVDLVTSNQDADTITWYENDGSESFTRRTIDADSDGAKRADVADIDDDGDLDVVSASFFDDTIAWYENDGSESFVERQIDGNANGAYYVTPADLDADGDVDLLTASQIDDRIAWYENDGSGGFTKRVMDSTALGARTVIAADLDGDGDLDAIAASVDDDTVAWYENDGSGGFSVAPIDVAVPGAYGLTTTDLDADGDLDVISASRDADAITLHAQTRRHATTLGPGETVVLDGSLLSVVDDDDGPAELTYEIVSAPTDGELRLDTTPMSTGATFTQADVDAGRVSYVHDGVGTTADRFDLTVADGGEGGLDPLTTSFDLELTDPADLLVDLRLDETSGTTATDASGSGNDGTLIGGAAFDPATPDGSASSVRLDGVDDAIELAPFDVDGSGLTVAAWFRADSFPGSSQDPRLISKASGVAADDHVFMLGTVRSGGETRLRARIRVAGSTTTLIASAGDLSTGQWHHAAVTYDGSLVRLYLDGVEVGSAALGGPVDQAPGIAVAIGAQPAGAGGRHFDGLIDGVLVLQRGLGATEVAALASGS